MTVAASDFSFFEVSGSFTTKTISGFSVSGAVVTVTVTVVGTGELRLDLADGDFSITDLQGNASLSAARTGDETWTVDQTAPSLTSINRGAAPGITPTNAATLEFDLTFSEPVFGLATSDFDFTLNSGAVVGSVTGVAGAGTAWTITVTGVSGTGNVQLDLNDSNNTIIDAVGNTLSPNTRAGDQAYDIDQTAPSVSSIVKGAAPGVNPTNAGSLEYTVTFDEDVVTLVPADFTVTTVSGTATATVSIVAGGPTAWTVTLTGATGDGDLRLDFTDGDNTVLDSSTNAVNPSTYTTGETYTLDNSGPTVLTINRGTVPATNPTATTSLEFTVTFDEDPTALVTGDFIATVVGVGSPSVSSVAGGPLVYTVTVDGSGCSGDVGLDFSDLNGTVQDTLTNAASPNTHTSDETWQIDTVGPSVVTINRGALPGPNPTNATTVDFLVTFDESVVSVVPADFTTSVTGTGASSVTGVAGSGATRTVTVTVTGVDGVVDLDLADANNTIQDALGNVISPNTQAGNQTWTVDNIAPQVLTVNRGTVPAVDPTNATSVEWDVTFDEAITPLVAADFTVSVTGIGAASISGIVGAGANWTVTVDTTAVDGVVDLDFTDLDNTVLDLGGNAVNPDNHAGDQSWTVDSVAPAVTSIIRGSVPAADPTNANTIEYDVTFNEAVVTLVAADFTVTTTGSATGSVTGVSGSGTSWTVTVGSVAGDGTLRLDLSDGNNSVQDSSGNAVSPNTYNGDQVWTIDNTQPSIVTINRGAVPATNPTTATTVEYSVTFSETVTNVVAGDFALTTVSGGVTGTISGVSGSGSSYTVTVNSITGNGTLRLDLSDGNNTIIDTSGNTMSPNTQNGDETWQWSVTASILGSWQSGTTHTATAGSNRLLVVVITAEWTGGAKDITGMTYGGQTMTQVIENATSGDKTRTEIWRLGETGIAAAGSTTIGYSGGAMTGVNIESVMLGDINQGAPVNGTGVGSANGTTATANLSFTACGINIAGGVHPTTGASTMTISGTGWSSNGFIAANGISSVSGYEVFSGTAGSETVTLTVGSGAKIGMATAHFQCN